MNLQRRLLYQSQAAFNRDFKELMQRILEEVITILGTDEVIPIYRSWDIMTRIEDAVSRPFLNGDFERILNRHLSDTQNSVLMAQREYMQKQLSGDLVQWLSTATPSSESPLKKSGDQRDRILATLLVLRAKLSKYLTYNIRAGTPANRITRDMTNMLLPDREVLSTTVPLGVNLSFDPSRLARVEMTNAYTAATFAVSALNPFVGGMDWALSIRHPKVDICDRLATIGMSGNRLRPPYPINSAPHAVKDSHINCVTGDTLVEFPAQVSAATQSFYSGLVVKITTNSGRRLSVTPNHPILTTRGWVAAQFINEGDKVVSAINSKGVVPFIHPNDNNVPTRAEQVFRSIQESGSVVTCTMPLSPEDFHGDARLYDRDVNIVYPLGFLGDDRHTHISEPSSQLYLINRDFSRGAFVGQGSFNLRVNAKRFTSNSVVSSGSHSVALVLSHSAESYSLGFTSDADSNTEFAELLAQQTTVDVINHAEFFKTKTRFIFLDNVLNVDFADFSGHVYNFHVDPDNWYFANGIITHNCICSNIPYISNSLDLSLQHNNLETAYQRGDAPPFTPLSALFAVWLFSRVKEN
jgi:hypothetical protein